MKRFQFWHGVSGYEVFTVGFLGATRFLTAYLNGGHPLEKVLVPLGVAVCGLTLYLEGRKPDFFKVTWR